MKRKKIFKKKKEVDDDIRKSLDKSFSKTIKKYGIQRTKDAVLRKGE